MEVADYSARLLGQPVSRTHQVRREGDRGHAGIGHTDVGKTVDAKVGVHHSTLVQRKHRTCRRWMKFGEGLAAYEFIPLIITLDVGARPSLRHHILL